MMLIRHHSVTVYYAYVGNEEHENMSLRKKMRTSKEVKINVWVDPQVS